MGCCNSNGDILYNYGIGDWFISDEQKRLNESLLKSDELQRQQTEAMVKYLSEKKVSAGTASSGIDQQTMLILGGVGVLTVFMVIMMT